MDDNKVMDLLEAASRLEAVMAALEQTAERLQQQPVGPIVGTVEESAAPAPREAELERRLAEAEAKIAQLSAQASAPVPHAVRPRPESRQTLAPGTATLLAKQGIAVDAGGVALEAAALDGALATLSIEQRIAVKSELMRAGLLS